MVMIVTHVRVRNLLHAEAAINFDGRVATGVAHVVLPAAWKERLGELNTVRWIDCETATQNVVSVEVCWPVEIRLDGFSPIYGEVLFLEMNPSNGQYEPLVSYIVLEQSQAAVDTLGHRLVHVKRTDLKMAARFS